jgi:hypothetical protein
MIKEDSNLKWHHNLSFYSIMADTTPIPNAPQQAVEAAQQAAAQVQAQAQQIADTAHQIAADPTKAVGMVADQVTSL